nr:hypothetical protein [Pedobacter panaciterrae]
MKFNIKNTFAISYKKLFVLVGNPEAGDLSKGKKIFIEELKLDLPIHSIETVDLLSKESLMGITVGCKTQEEFAILSTLKEGDYVVIVE